MFEEISKLKGDIESYPMDSAEKIESFRLKYLSKKGIISGLFSDFKHVPPDQKRVIGLRINEIKALAQSLYDSSKIKLSRSATDTDTPDYTSTPYPIKLGSRHPVSIVRKEIIEIFSRIGFTVSEGPEIEDDWHVFSGLNFSDDHPARDMQDTFFINKSPDHLLRTHTSSVQVRIMESSKPPIRQLFPGRVFRNEAISARSHCIFHQVEGLYIDTDVSFSDLKQTLLYFAKELFGSDTRIRLRPSFFPFTEPSAEMDISCSICRGKGCNVCKYTGFLEILGCGMIDPNVLKDSHIDPLIYSGFAFGMGIERTAILKYKINDIRYLFENDVRFLDQFI